MITRVVVTILSVALAVSLETAALADSSPTLTWKRADGHAPAPCVEVAGLAPAALGWFKNPDRTPAEHNAALAVHVVQGGADATICLGGRYTVVGEVVRFTPRHPLEPGLSYRAILDLDRLGSGQRATPARRIVADYQTSKAPEGSRARVVAIHPTSKVLPENLLRLYIQFSAPMSRGEAYRRVHLRDAQGVEVDAPFLELDEELWSADQTRFTLLLDPGRIKRGLKPREELGPALIVGNTYSIVVDATWQDAHGATLEKGAIQSFRVGPADQTSPDPTAWRVDAPRAGGREPLVIHFPDPMDHALLERMLTVHDAAGRPVVGTVAVDPGEQVWRWHPREAWVTGDYRIVIDVELEDVAGNSVARPFEVDETTPITPRTTVNTRELTFRVVPSGP